MSNTTNKPKKRIWIDMTDMQVWSGHMTGIQRVVYQNAKRFVGSPAYDARCFVFDDRRKVFTEVSFADIESSVEAAMVAGGGQASDGGPPVSLTGMVKRLPRAVLRRIPASVKRRVPSLAKRAIKKGARLGVNALRRGKATLQTKLAAPDATPVVTFTAADTVLILGKSWDFPDLIPTLGRLKQEQGFRLVHLIHDLIPIFEPHLFGPGLFEPYTRCIFDVCSLSDGILANSESTKRDVARFCKELAIPTPPLQHVRLGDDLADMELGDDMPAPDPRIKKGQFVLQVGTIEARKNHLLVYLAYREAALRGIELPTWVIIGSQGWLVGDVMWQIQHDPLLKDKAIVLGGRPDSERLWLFKNCRLTTYPSTYEGWGMPVAESLQYGKVCITSKTSSMPEVGGKAADLVSPYNTEEMLQALLRYQDDKVLAAREKEIAKLYKLTSWDDTFRGITKFLGKL